MTPIYEAKKSYWAPTTAPYTQYCSCDSARPVTWTLTLYLYLYLYLYLNLCAFVSVFRFVFEFVFIFVLWDIAFRVTWRLALYLSFSPFPSPVYSELFPNCVYWKFKIQISIYQLNLKYIFLLYVKSKTFPTEDVTPAPHQRQIWTLHFSTTLIHPRLAPFWCMDWPRPFYRGSPAVLNKVPVWEMGLWREVMLVMSDRIHPHISPLPTPTHTRHLLLYLLGTFDSTNGEPPVSKIYISKVRLCWLW